MNIVWTDRASTKLEAILNEISAEQPNAAMWVIREIRRTAELVALWPQVGSAAPRPGVRTFPVPGTKYLLAFQHKESTVFIVSIFHGAQNWKRKFPQ
ncbi:type II toxin-antitoxin system RelE/ParE family toxin [Terriglobus sp. RCC_193]|uniref:type II toxin-antitoxin system RelE/ParE family toxin n=1 Tax=Terriglobus sp. RCC_193 TaxID=3239218 RepID=UPI0035257EA7